MSAIASRLYRRFQSSDRAHGRFIPDPEKKPGSKKLDGKFSTPHEPIQLELFEQHLAGTYGIGGIPIRDGNVCWWGAIDLDIYEGFDWAQLERDLVRLDLGLIPCKTKSGGCHLYLFLQEECSAKLVRTRLTELATALGHPAAEVFPKQIRLDGDDDIGNWLNFPYFGGEETSRYAVSNGARMTVEKFLDMADEVAWTKGELETFKLPAAEDGGLLHEAPPCLQCLAKQGCGEGVRNKFAFNLGVYARKRFGDDYADKLDAFNQELMQPPLGHKEVAQVVKSVGKKDYGYTCKDEPIKSVCDRDTCLTREYGIGGGTKGHKPTAVDLMLDAVTEVDGELWHTADDRTFVSLTLNGHREHLRVSSTAFRRFLIQSYGKLRGAAPNAEALQNVITFLDARAIHEGKEYLVAIRIAEEAGAIYIDLANEAREAVRITGDRWEITSDVPVRFHRPPNMKALPRPERSGSIELLRPFFTVETDEDWRLLVAFIIGCLRPRGPYAQLHISGVKGSAKTTLARVTLALIDPRIPAVRSLPKTEDNLMIQGVRQHLLVYDNLSGISAELSDALCRISTGGGLGKRTLYTDDEETAFDVVRPVILTGINEIAAQADLRDRALTVDLPPIAPDRYRDEETLWAEFEAVRPLILGALYDAVSRAVRDWSTTKVAAPRMADFARWVTAAEPSLGWEPGTFLGLYRERRDDASARAVEQDVLASAVRDLAEESDYRMTCRDLLGLLGNAVGPDVVRQHFWPKTARALRAALKRAAPDLLTLGVEIDSGRGTDRWIALSKVGRTGVVPMNKPSVAPM